MKRRACIGCGRIIGRRSRAAQFCSRTCHRAQVIDRALQRPDLSQFKFRVDIEGKTITTTSIDPSVTLSTHDFYTALCADWTNTP